MWSPIIAMCEEARLKGEMLSKVKELHELGDRMNHQRMLQWEPSEPKLPMGLFLKLLEIEVGKPFLLNDEPAVVTELTTDEGMALEVRTVDGARLKSGNISLLIDAHIKPMPEGKTE